MKELLHYNRNVFAQNPLISSPSFPLAAEPHVAAWETYLAEAEVFGVFEVLRSRLVQLQFPVQSGISETPAYRAATRKGTPTSQLPEATGLNLQQPDALQLRIHPSLAGKIPVLIAGCRADFVTLVQALAKRNEPHPIPDVMGAVIVAGYNNWDRIRQYRHRWEANQPQPVSEEDWKAEFQQLIPQKALYQDCFILLSTGNYSAVSAAEMGMEESTWRNLSVLIRLEHECAHYFTRRLLGSMQNNLMDELIADYRGIVVANNGCYRADWFLRFLGLESFPHYREGGRLENYRGNPPLSEGAFKVLQCLVRDAALNLETFHQRHHVELAQMENQALTIMALTRLTLEELAASTDSLAISYSALKGDLVIPIL
jgi:hypothetical protein